MNATIFFSCKNSVEEPLVSSIIFSPDGTTATSDGEPVSTTFTVETNVDDWDVQLEPDNTWLKVVVNKAANTFTLSAEPVGLAEPDPVTVTVTAGEADPVTINVTQTAVDISAPREYYVKVDGTASSIGLSWNMPTTLTSALSYAVAGSTIHIAEGVYLPETNIAGGSDPQDVSFLISRNITLIGGYPANVSDENAISDPANHPTILDGNNSYHCLAIIGPIVQNSNVTLKGLTITGGEAGAAAAGNATVGGSTLPRNFGGGIIVRNVEVIIEDCDIKDNKTLQHAAGVYVYSASNATFRRTKIRDNIGTGGNGGGIWNEASVVYMYDSEVSGNQTWGVAAGVYAIHASLTTRTYMFNVTISGNKTTATNAAAGFYGRENSISLMVNCTVADNESGTSGGGITMYSNARLDIINSTITGNRANSGNGGGILMNTAMTQVVNLYNTIVSGNTASGTGPDLSEARPIETKSFIIAGESVHDGDGAVVPGTTFNFATHLGSLADNGGFTKTCALIGVNNPAVTRGISVSALRTLGASFDPPVATEIIEYDQTGKSREGKNCMGAVVD